VRTRRSAVDHIADHGEPRELPDPVGGSSLGTSMLPSATFSVVPPALPATIDEDLDADEDVVASEVDPAGAAGAVLADIRPPDTDAGETVSVAPTRVDGVRDERPEPEPAAKVRPTATASSTRKVPPARNTASTGAPTKGAPRKAAPTKAAPTKAAPTKAAPTKAAPGKAAPGKAAPGKAEPTAVQPPAPERSEPAVTKAAPTPTTARPTAAEAATPAIVVDLPPAGEPEVPAEELALAIDAAPVTTPEGLTVSTSSLPVVSGEEAPAERDETADTASPGEAFAGMSVARALAGAPESPAMLTAERLLDDRRDSRRVPQGFWQKLLFDLSGRRIRVSDSRSARAQAALTARIAQPLAGPARFVPVLTRKGGVGKTTVTTLLGMALADARDDRVIAVDANPDRGTLAERIARRSEHTVRDLVQEADTVAGYSEFSALVARDVTRLDVLASDSDPHLSEAFDQDDYDVVARLASQYYSIVLTDCGTGMVHSVMGATLRHADALVIVSGTSVDEARSASETVSWLEANGYASLAQASVVVINSTTPGTPRVRLDEIEKHFESRVRSIVRVPFDPHLAAGAAVTFADLSPATRAAAREVAATVVEGLPARRTGRGGTNG
jgi:MinD-like ATPase involved in chromosome partitioning or flagellar assembly